MNTIVSHLRASAGAVILMTAICGLAYPFAVTGAAQLVAKPQADGSMIRNDKGEIIGSALIAQGFAKPEYFWPRPSAAGAKGYDAMSSGGSNLGPQSKVLADRVATDAKAWRAANETAPTADALTASGSGLDPDISPANAQAQAARVAKARGLSEAQVKALVAAQTEAPILGILGDARVNVLKLNLALDKRFARSKPETKVEG